MFQAAFSAVAFAGAGYLFQHLNKSGYEDEMKRHNKAAEDLAEAKELFDENEIKRKDEIMCKRQELSNANSDISETNKALDNLYHIQHAGKMFTYTKRPKLSDYYKPSREMAEYHVLVSSGIALGVGYLLFKFL